MSDKAYISEVFCSLQGEGIYLGEKQIFCRFAGCNLNCSYCDTPQAKKIGQKILLNEILDKIFRLQKFYSCKNISLTGGEPLLQVGFLKNLLTQLKKKKFIVYLETNGVLPDNLKKIIDFCDIIAMDIKLPSDSGKSFWEEHRDFLQIGKEKNIFVKAIISEKTREEELLQAAIMVRKISKRIPFVLQPASQKNKIDRLNIKKAESFFYTVKKILPNLFLIPQYHKIWGLR